MVLLILIGAIIALLPLFLSIRGIFGERHLRVQSTLVCSPIKSLAAGVGVALAVFGAFVGLQATGVALLSLVSVVIVAVGLVAVLFGLVPVASTVGERVLALRSRESSPFAQTSVGALFLAIMGSLPFLGWFLIAPVAALLGLGAIVISVARRGLEGSAVA